MTARRFFAWWRGELVACVPNSWRRSASLGDMHIRLRGHAADFSWPGTQASTITLNDPPPPRPSRSRLLPCRRVRITLPEKDTLTQTLDLPLAVEPELSSVLELDIDRLSPFAADDVRFTWQILSRDRQAETLRVAVHIMSREEIEVLRRRLQRWKLPSRNATAQIEGWPSERAINLSDQAGDRQSHPTRRRLNTALAAATLLACIWTAYDRWQTVRMETQSVAGALLTAKTDVDRVLQIKRQLALLIDRQNEMRRLRIDRPTLTEVLGRFAESMDDQTWLDQLWIEHGALRIHGRTLSATDLITRLNDLSFVNQARFDAPIVTDPRDDADRFQISAMIGRAQRPSP
jgi:general secretion pathway protein L